MRKPDQRPQLGVQGKIARLACAWGGLLLACLLVPANAADRPTFPPGSALRFRHIGLEDGLAQSSVLAIAQDAQGYMWFGTQDGLQRYDGYDFQTFRHDAGNMASLADNFVSALAASPDGSLWVGTLGMGLDRLEPGGARFIHYQHDPHDAHSLAGEQISALLLDRAGRLWVGTDQGLERMEGGGFRHYALPTKLQDGKGVLSLYQDQSGRLWVGGERGLFWYDAAHDAVEAFRSPDPAPTPGVFTESPVHSIVETSDGLVWIGTGRGVVQLDHNDHVRGFFHHAAGTADSLSSDHAIALLEDAAGDVWVGTFGGGISRYDPATRRFTNFRYDATDPGGLSGDSIDCMYRDRTGLVWIGTDSNGINVYNPGTRAFGYYRHRQGDPNSLADNVVWSVYEDARAEVWVATGNGITRLDNTRRHYTQYQLGDRPANQRDDASVNVVAGDRSGGLWAGAAYGLYRYEPGSDSFRHYHLVSHGGNPDGDSVSAIFADAAGRLWVGTGDGLVRFDPGTGAVQRYRHDPNRPDSLPDPAVSAICQSRDGTLWVGTSGGLAGFDGVHDRFRNYHADPHAPDSLSYDAVQACLADSSGGLWVGTSSGLDRMDIARGNFRRYSTVDGLPNNTIYAVLEDGAGGIWVSTDDGLSRLDPRSGSFRNYGISDGLQSIEFDSGAAFAAPDGELFFGGVNGLNAFHPDRLHPNEHAPKVAITRFVRFGKPVELLTPQGPLKQVEVEYHENILSFEFTAFDYAAPSMNSFSYRLDGFETGWHTIRGRRAVTYTNLDPGRYTLEVKGANSDGVESIEPASLVIDVLPPAWRTWWAWLLYVTIGFVSLMLALSLYKRAIKREHDLHYEQQRRHWAESLHNLIHSVSLLRDERAVAEQLIDTITNFIHYDHALFFVERDNALMLIASRGIDASRQAYLEHWPGQQRRIVEKLRQARKPLLLAPEDAATLESVKRAGEPLQYLAVPLFSGTGSFRLLLVAREGRVVDAQQMEIAAAMAKQVSVALDNAQLIKDLENLATTDGLTRLYNRRHFMERAESEFERSRRYQRELSVLLLDADHFKHINDDHGHETGDRVLRVLASTCRQSLRQLDVIGRYGGEEFVVLLPETSAALAAETAERLRREIEQLRVPAPAGEIHVTVSIGVATAGPATESVAALINEADRALYEAKRGGRNRVTAASAGRKT